MQNPRVNASFGGNFVGVRRQTNEVCIPIDLFAYFAGSAILNSWFKSKRDAVNGLIMFLLSDLGLTWHRACFRGSRFGSSCLMARKKRGLARY
jgi:hypothetical protein